MPSIWLTIGSALGYVFKPQLKSPRILGEGPTPSNLGLLAIVSAVIILLAVVLTGQTFNLYLPHYFLNFIYPGAFHIYMKFNTRLRVLYYIWQLIFSNFE